MSRYQLEIDGDRVRLTGWFCADCGAFNGCEKEELKACRTCTSPQPSDIRTPGFASAWAREQERADAAEKALSEERARNKNLRASYEDSCGAAAGFGVHSDRCSHAKRHDNTVDDVSALLARFREMGSVTMLTAPQAGALLDRLESYESALQRIAVLVAAAGGPTLFLLAQIQHVAVEALEDR